MKTITILGSTGSVGKQVLGVIEKHPEDFKVVGLSAYSNKDLLEKQIKKFNPKFYYCKDGAIEVQTSVFDLLDENKNNVEYVDSLEELAKKEADIVVLAISGLGGIKPSLEVLKRGGVLAIANKEAIVCGGKFLKEYEKKYNGKILPLDSEHSCIFECLKGENSNDLSKIILTASGGALRDVPISKLYKVKAEDALKHPNWSMGKKITIDCATLFNKGLEVIEASKLFDISVDKIEVVIHRESIIHSFVEFKDGSLKALLASPDMALPIETALYYPELGKDQIKPLNIAKLSELTFSEPDLERYPCLKVVLDAANYGDGACVAICSADEILVSQYLKGKIHFDDIALILEKVLKKFKNVQIEELDDIENTALDAEKYTKKLLKIE